ncbi:unnamed protein product, partial [Nesidiocoris tenuis]
MAQPNCSNPTEYPVHLQCKRAKGRWTVVKFRASEESSWLMVPTDSQELVFHSRFISENDLIGATTQKTVLVHMTAADQMAYKRLCGDINSASDSDSDPESHFSEAPMRGENQNPLESPEVIKLISMINESNAKMIETQQQNFSALFSNVMDSVSSSFGAAVKTIAARPQKMTVPKFAGKTEDPSTWMCLFEKACKNNSWTLDEEKIDNLLSVLEPGSIAEKWYNSRMLQDIEPNWELWRRSFLSAFGQNPIQLLHDAQQYRYESGNLLEYYYEKQRLLNLAFGCLPARAFNLLVLQGLPSYMQTHLLAMDLDNREDLLKSLERLKPMAVRAELRNGRGNGVEQNNTFKTNHRRPANLVTTEHRTEEADDGILKVDVLSSYNIGSSNNKPLIVPIDMNGSVVQTLLDTGAMVNLVSSGIVEKNNWATKIEKGVLRGFNNSTENVTQVTQLTVKSSERRFITNAFVLDSLPYEAILGWPTLSQLGVGLSNVKPLLACPVQGLPECRRIYSKDDLAKFFPKEDDRRPEFLVDFKLRSDAPVVKLKPYRLAKVKYEWAQSKIQDLLDRNIIRPSTSEFATPCVVVPKEGGTWRLCQDFREINKYTELDPFPFPIIDDVICNLGGCKFFSKLDLKEGFHQLHLTEESKKFTAFVLPFGHFEYNRMPFGWKNSPAQFQRMMTAALGELLKDPTIKVYIDDIIIGGRTAEECAEKTFLVVQKLKNARLQLNLDKSVFVQPKVTFLGRVIDGKTKTTKEESIEKVRNMKRPHDLHTVRIFTGLTGHFRAFIPNYAQIVRPLDNLKKKETSFNWTPDAESAFQTLTAKITSAPVLQLPDWKLPFELNTDASHQGCGAVLYQRDINQKKLQQLRVIGYYSYSFSKAELNYCVTDKEALAVKKAVQYFRPYLECRPFTVYTDHQALTCLMNMKEPKGRLGRWQIFLQGFEMNISHRRGQEMEDADAVSRLCLGDQPDVMNISVIETDSKGKLLIEKSLVPEIMRAYHDDQESGGHDGFLRTYNKLKQRFTWPHMKDDIKKYVRSCHQCQMIKFKFSQKPDQLVLPKLADNPFESIHLDFAEVAKKSESQKTTKSFLVLIDEFSR